MTLEEMVDGAIYKAALEANANLHAELNRYKEASFRDAVEFSKFRTMLQVAQDRITQAHSEGYAKAQDEIARLREALDEMTRERDWYMAKWRKRQDELSNQIRTALSTGEKE